LALVSNVTENQKV